VRVCAITNVYNEAFSLPIWLRYYGGQLGIENCIVVDDGSDDGSTADLGGASRLRLPRLPFDDGRRGDLMSSLATSMLRYYDAVIYSDCDEILVADPRKYSSLIDFCERFKGPGCTAIGLNVIHNLAEEGPIDPSRPILDQRSYVHFQSSMCKTLLVRSPVSWGGGFHSSSLPVAFSDLYLFHLKMMDLGEALRRLALTRELNLAKQDGAGRHQRISNETLIQWSLRDSKLQLEEGFDFSPLTTRFSGGVAVSHNQRYYFTGQFSGGFINRIPAAFKVF
jgi:hypothetical protein